MLRFLLTLAGLVSANGLHWAVLVAGSNGYFNYRHQADVCHAYKTLIAKGMSPHRIITMAYDDIANATENPFKGKIFNRPDPKGPGVDVYEGCKLDYKGKDVNVQNFLKVLTGDKTATGKVLSSGPRDHVFINFVDHGAPGLVAFPRSELHKADLEEALNKMHTQNMYKRLVFYLEACESGSMFKDLKTPGVFAVSASNPSESSWGTYCPGMSDNAAAADMVNGKHLGTCLGDLFSVNWMEDSDVENTKLETLAKQFDLVVNKTNKSHVMKWGDNTFIKDTLSQYIGNQFGEGDEQTEDQVALPPVLNFDINEVSVQARKVDMHIATVGCEIAGWSEDCGAQKLALQREQTAATLTHRRLVSEAVAKSTDVSAKDIWSSREEPANPACELAAHAALRENCASRFNANSGFALGLHQVIVNLCAYSAKGALAVDVPALAAAVCADETMPLQPLLVV
mmetsp:Transcript_63081/g.150352  ORF Transcript_63081/g.150352 Transcript_63081/m.150352 type:complete len:455 (-) Transcript_63081:165-1529(-)